MGRQMELELGREEGRRVPVLSYGMGVDSTAALLRMVHEPEVLREKGFELTDLVTITAMVGNEFTITGKLVEEHILPLLREHGVRYVQVARNGPALTDGHAVLADGRCPTEVHLKGKFRIADEYLYNGTGPETCGRKCSIKFKGNVMDAWFEENLGPETEMLHAIGYAKGEEGRAVRDDVFSGKRNARSPKRIPWHPLIEWGWDRAKCIDYIREKTGVEAWPKSCCTFCPFAGPKKDPAGQADHLAYLDRLEAAPEEGAEALLVEFNNMTFNHRQTLYNRAGTLLADLRKEGKTRAVAAFEEVLGKMEWALYRVRRVQALTKAGNRINTDRALEKLETGERAELEAKLAEMGGTVTHEGGIPKVFITRRRVELAEIKGKKGIKAAERKVTEVATNGPITEEFYTVAPAFAETKVFKTFEVKWAELNT
jgi:hypothetical protein